MENILYNISQVLGITILHSLWQGLLIYFMLRMVLMSSDRLSSSKKYILAVTSLLAITGWFIYTLVNQIHIYNWLAVAPAKLSATPLMAELPADLRQFNNDSIRYYYNIEGYLPYITILYIAGLLFNATRLILSRKKINAIRKVLSIDIALQYKVSKFAEQLKIGKSVKVGLSKLVDVPCMVGYFKPAILLPFSMATFLSASEIEAILLHELAHIKRNDYLINLLQQVISILLFFNPCTQLINRIINEERENSCDDMVVNTTSDALMYAKALLKLEQSRENELQLAMAAIGKKHHLLNRIERIMKTKKQTQSVQPALMAMLILTIGIGSIALFNPQIAEGKISVKAIVPVINKLTAADTIKKAAVKKSATAKTYRKPKAVIKGENGNGNIYVYDSNNNHNFNYNHNGDDPELDRLSAEVEKHGDAIDKYYESPEFKKLSDDMDAKGKEIQAFYDRPELKKLQEEQEKLSSDFDKKWSDNSETNKLSEQMDAIGKKMDAYYNSARFKDMAARLEKKYGIKHDDYYDDRDENHMKFREELKANIPADIANASEQMKSLGQQMRERYKSPEYIAERDAMKKISDSLRSAYHNPQVKQQQEEMRQLSQKMREFSHNPEIEKEKQLLKEATAKMRAYQHSPEYIKHLSVLDEAPEAPEKPEAPAKPVTDN
jgi:bla regulator protein BlaR1